MELFDLVWHIVGMSTALVVGLTLVFRLLRKFDYATVFGLLVAYLYVVEDTIYILFDPFPYMLLNKDERLQTPERSREPLVAPAAATIATLETVAVIVIAVNLLLLGSSYRRTESQTNLLYLLAIGAAVMFSLFLTPRVLMYLGYFVYGNDAEHSPFAAYWVVDGILEFVTHALAFAYAFIPTLSLMYKTNITVDSRHTIGAHRAAEGMWYAHVFVLYLIQTTAVRIASPLAPQASICLNSVHVAMGSLTMLALALPAPRFFAENVEREYESRLSTLPNNVMQAPTPKNAIRVTFVDGNGKHMSGSHQETHESVLTVPVILASNVNSW